MFKIYSPDKYQNDLEKYISHVYNGFLNEEDCKKMTDEELLQVLKQSPEFNKLVFPNSWYKKFELPKKECMNMKEFLAESPWQKKHLHFYTGKVEQIEAKPGGNRPILDVQEAPMTILLQNSFSDAEGPKETSDASTNQTSSSGPQETLRL